MSAIGSCGLERRVGLLDGGLPGPSLVVVAGIHGNEPAGLRSARRLLEEVEASRVEVRGRIEVLAGNLPALASRRRHVDRDLNRGWDRDASEGVLSEDRDQRELVRAFEGAARAAGGPLLVADLHSTSGGGPPFLCLADRPENLRLGRATGIPMLLGIERAIGRGTLLEWLTGRGIANLAIEGGRHDDPSTIENHVSALWLLLEVGGLVRPGSEPVERHRRRLAEVARGLPRAIDVLTRHPTAPGDGFRMEEGLSNLQRVERGRLLARDRRGEIRAPWDGILLLPRYQPEGDDGFFLGRERDESSGPRAGPGAGSRPGMGARDP
ncbi:MAG: hypothetical protein Fur0037_20620 [Planctomycetota bacterium]